MLEDVTKTKLKNYKILHLMQHGETVLCHGNVDRKSDHKPVGDNNGAIDSVRLRPEDELESKEHSGALSNMKSRGGKAGRLQYAVNDSTSDDEEKLRDFVAPIRFSRSSLEIESFEKDSVFYVDKSVMEPELPELVVCYKENTYHVVKDICIDEGVPSKDKFLFDTDVDEQQLCTFLISEDKHSEIGLKEGDLDMHIPDLLKSSTEKENLAIGNPVTDVLISSKEKGSRNEFSLEHDLNKSMPAGKIEQGAIENVVNGASREIFSLGELLSMAAMGADLSQPKSSHNMDKAEQLAQRPLENTILTRSRDSEESENVNEEKSLVSPPTVYKAEESDFGCEEASIQILNSDCAGKESDHGCDRTHLSSPPESVAEESHNDSKEEVLEGHNTDVVSELNRTIGDKFNNSKLDTKSITFDSNSSAPIASRGEDGGSLTGSSGHPEARSSSRPEDNGTEPFSSQLQYCPGESSFSAAGPVSGLISYSGPIAYSGSLSLRSDSSTTSTRSFAFPILQSEWNSSPVRMAKAERRCIRKHRGWRQAILCCRF